MKKTIVVMAAVVALGLAGYQLAKAQPGGWGGGYGWMMGPGYGMMAPGAGPQGYAVHQDAIKARQQFLDATAQVRKQLIAKRAEWAALMRSTNPDPQKAATLSSEIFELQDQLRKKAAETGLATGAGYGGFFCSGPFAAGPGAGYGFGPRHRGWCW